MRKIPNMASSIRVLLVDDNKDALQTYAKALLRTIRCNDSRVEKKQFRPESYIEVETADTVSSSFNKLKSLRFDILIIDLKIPGLTGDEMGGLEVIDESLRLDPLRPIIVLTGFGTVQLAKRTLTKGVFDFIEKSSTAVDDLTKAVQKAIDRSHEKGVRFGNPFTPMSGVEPTVFGGRTKELEFFEEKLNRALNSRFCDHFIILGNWGIGKSTLLKEFKKISQSRGHIASVVLLEQMKTGTTLMEAARSIIEGILRDLPYPVSRFNKVVQFFDSVGINVLGTGLEFSRDTTKKALSPQAFLHDSLVSLCDDLKDKTDILLLLLDDLDNFAEVSEIVMTLKQTLSMNSLRKNKILVGLASTLTHWQELTSLKKHHPLSRYFMSRTELVPLRKDELTETILKSLSGTGVSFDMDVIDRVYEYTEGHPFEMQVLCCRLFNNHLSRRVELEVWDKALQGALSDMGNAVFENWFRQASGEEAKVLRVIAEGEAPVSIKEVQEKAKAEKIGISPNNIAKYLQRLMEKDLLSKSGRGMYFLSDRMFRAYIRTCE